MARTSTKRTTSAAVVGLSTHHDGPKRSSLAQERSRETRRKLVKAALDLWSERGFETGIDSTTAEEIAARAGVAKGTFYFHFARKEQVLLEMGWLTARALYEDALGALANGRISDPAARDIDTVTIRETLKTIRDADDWTPALIPTGAGLLAAVKTP